MIVKNEAARILRALDSARDHIACFAILDTGSTDGTPDVIREWAEFNNIPGDVGHGHFETFAQARNDSLALARKRDDWDYLILFDADMELVVKDPDWLYGVIGKSHSMYQIAGALHYANSRLLSRFSDAIYLCPTHEFLNEEITSCIPKEKAYFNDYADGSNRHEKFKRDIRIFKKALKNGEGPQDRIFYYLAQSYRDAGQFANAIKWYQRRIDLGGWAEEVWSAHTNIAACHRALGNIGEFLRWNIAAYNYRPSRGESLYDIAKYFREEPAGQAASLIFSEAGMRLPMPNDMLFVNDFIYRQGFKDEFSICAFYMDGRRDDGFRVADELSLTRGPYGFSSAVADSNLLHYMRSLGDSCPSLALKQIDFQAEEHWTAMNPSVCLHRGELKALVRTVNYRMDEDGRYLIRATDGTANNSNPINTRNWLVPLDRGLNSITQIELVPREPQSVEYPLVIGFEDARIFDHDNNLYISATVRQRCADGLAEQTLARIGGPAGAANDLGGYARLGLDDVRPMLRTPRLYEKNWMPITGRQEFMYRPGHRVGWDGQDIGSVQTPRLRTDSFSGSSQLIEFREGWLGIVHEAHYFTDAPHKRYYSHRFVFYGSDFQLVRVSRPFFFKDKTIEFVAGFAWHPDPEAKTREAGFGKDLVISFGFKDCEAWLARVSAAEVWRFVCQGQEEPKSAS